MQKPSAAAEGVKSILSLSGWKWYPQGNSNPRYLREREVS